MVETINKPIRVIALFEHGQIKPLRVEWNARTYHVSAVNNVWRETVGTAKHIHLAVETKEGVAMELVVDPKDMSWRLESVDTE